ncbi:complement C3 [Gadus morhua]|nr:complement C3-like [Gadus morhua]
MHLAVLPLSVACLVLFLSSVAPHASLKVLSAPNVLRIGATENIFVECQECSEPEDVTIIVSNFPSEKYLGRKTVTLTETNQFQAFVEIKIPADEFKADPDLKQHVSLEARFSDSTTLKKVVLLSLQSGHIFIQTDKPLYTPNSIVNYRVFAVTHGMEPVDEKDLDAATITVYIVTPHNVFGSDPVAVRSGIYSGSYVLPDIVSTGVWKVVAVFENSKGHNFSSEFEVKEYVLPSIEVKLTTDKEFFHVDDEQLTVNIEAEYLFGREVEGTAFVVFGILNEAKEKKSFPNSFQRVMISKGKGTAMLKREHILQTYDKIEELVKSSIYIAVTVLTDSGSEMVEAEKQGIQIVKSPYTIHFKYTSKYFKPFLPFYVVVNVENPDGSPAPDVQLVVEPGTIPAVTGSNGIAWIIVNNATTDSRSITVTTNEENLQGGQTSETMVAYAYSSSTKNYLHIGVGSILGKLGDSVTLTFSLQRPQTSNVVLTYLIQSRGQLVEYGRYRVEGKSIGHILQVTKEMLPSFRIIAYYQSGEEVVSDSVWVDVEDTCIGSLKLEETRNAASFTPQQKFELKITGNPGATVGLVAVDKRIYVLNNKHRLTQKKVWDVVEKADTGCTPGGGMDNMRVFHDAGLLFQSNFIGTADRQGLKCPSSIRKKRASAIPDVRTTLLSDYKDSLLRQCCLDGMAETPLSYSCERRMEYISDGKACADAFLKCCQELTKLRTESRTEALSLARSEEKKHEFIDSDDISSRTVFPESWLWTDHKLPLCPEHKPNCRTTSLVKRLALPDTITTWHLTGISLSPTKGICIDDTLKIGPIVRKDFFIDLRLPYSAVRGEQIEIKAILHNYLHEEITVQIHLIETENVCSSASNKGKYTQTVKVASESTRSVPFVIIPMQHGTIPIEIKASTMDRNYGIRKVFKVVPQGTLVIKIVSKDLSPAKYNGVQVENITIPIDVKDILPKTPSDTQIFVTGGVQMLVEKVLDGSYMSSLIKQPSGCGEQNVARMSLPVIATTYLDKTNQWDRVGTSKRDVALGYISSGYQTQLKYRKRDGSYTIFQGAPSSWLTAYVAKVFAIAYKLSSKVEKYILCDAINWVIINSQKSDGSFGEVGVVSDGRIMVGIRGSDSDASMTAFSLIAIQEARPICEDVVSRLRGSEIAAVGYLERHLPSLTNPYAVAMVSYALANENKLNKEILYRFASEDSTHWPVANHELFTLEATAYALLALVKVKDFEDAAKIVQWLNTQTMVGGGYESTQSTTIVYQALAEYWVNAEKNDDADDMDVQIQVSTILGRYDPKTFKVNKEHAFQTRTTRFGGINQEVQVTAEGTGKATVSVMSMYYERTSSYKTLNCERFDLNVELREDRIAEYGVTYKLIIEILYKDTEEDADMTILDIGLLSGYIPDREDLNKLHKAKDRTIAKYEMNKVLSERGSLIIYLEKVSHTMADEVAFKIIPMFKVGVLQPATVSIYEYYNPKQCRRFYHPQRDQGKVLQICRDNQPEVCKCAEEECSMQKKDKIDNFERHDKACDAEVKIDYVYKVTMESYVDHNSTDVYMMRINQVIKEGSDKEPSGKLRTFIGYSHCRETLNLKTNASYLIMGTVKNAQKVGRNQYEYLLGEQSWIEYWPTPLECQNPKYGSTCDGMEELVFTFSFIGCSM